MPAKVLHPRFPVRLPSTLFALILASSATTQAQEAEEIAIVRTQLFDQYSPNIVSLNGGGDDLFEDGPVSFGVFAIASELNPITGGTFTAPDSLAVPLDEFDDEWFHNESFEFLPILDDTYPNGSYQVNLATNDGLIGVSIDLADADYLAVTSFSNFDDAQAIPAAQNFTLMWDAIVGATADDQLSLSIKNLNGDSVYFSGDFPSAELNGLDTQAIIPAETLNPGERYWVYLETYRISELDSDPAHPGTSLFTADSKVLRMPIRTAGALDDPENPILEEFYPYDGQGDTERDTAVIFRFNEPMDTSVTESEAITWTGLNPGLITYNWNPAGTILFCHYQTALPASTTVEWTLNPAGAISTLRDEANNELFPAQGFFTTGADAPAGGSGIREVTIAKLQLFGQEGTETKRLAYAADFYIDLFRSGSVMSGDLGIPGRGATPDAAASEEFSEFREFSSFGFFAEESDLDLIFPSGEYTATLNNGPTGTTVVSLTFGSEPFPNAPTVQGLAGLQSVDPTQEIVIAWDPMTGGTTDDVILIAVSSGDSCYFETPDLGEVGALDGTATSVAIPAGTLPPGRPLELELVFVKLVDEDDSVSFNTFAAIASITIMEISTSGDPVVPLTLSAARNGDLVTLTATGEVGFTYEVQSAPTLDNPIWSTLSFEFIPDDCSGYIGTFEFVDPESNTLDSRYYRVVQLPN